MQQHIHTIVKHFFQKDSLQEVPEQVLQQFTEDHPYSTVGHWLLAKKVYDTAPDRAATQSAHAVAWFNNPLWLHWTLQEHEPVAETLLIPTHRSEPVTTRPAPDAEATIPTATNPVEETPTAPEAIAAPEAFVAPVVETRIAMPEPAANEINDIDETEILIPGVSEPVSLVEEPLSLVDDVPPAITTAEIPASATETPEAIEAFKIQPVFFVPGDVTAAGPASTPSAASQPAENVQDTPAAAQETPLITIPLPGISGLSEAFKPSISENEEPVFEPYHTIDYFASLGIKLRDVDMKDKLGKQLKSFTDWLRSMKKIPPTAGNPDIPNAGDEDTVQQSIQAFASPSVEGKEIVTEAMAEVWVKQGSKQKAIAIYEKLSLLNPAKTPYFAARIEQIKAL
ncbi:hypothetical protein [Paraflavitalea sp. CAU 1676]|uniref:hypothetical protein n=1 Tax=Paraflavitalea sp. CAU 1676 TaxID=3032598 RepID=UPI0023DB7CF3|nr:hypothetical protein [Paraflavitalea sp. CAU 1676]MDF2191984.1 hypothetical protein [Paraflavitalea sp. CAU 1676]